jgi:two-component system, OmpR family, phosphate regulon sensor histidine kinase PhoR
VLFSLSGCLSIPVTIKEINVRKTDDAIHVLVVDDEQNIRDGSERILKRGGYEVLKAATGLAALELLAAQRVHIVLLDLKMPGMDGMDVLKRIRQLDASILVIVITGFATVETAIEAMKLGAYDFIPKPFEPEQLRLVVHRAADKLLLTRETQILEQERNRTLADLNTEKSRIRTVLESLPDGVGVINAQGEVVLMNPAFLHHLGLPPETEAGQLIEKYISDDELCRLIREISRGKHVDYEDIPIHELSISDEKFIQARSRPVLGDRRECLGAVVNLVDITSMKVIDRLKSEFVAKVSHELRSPLATIHEQLAHVLGDMVKESVRFDPHILMRAKEKTHGLISLIGDLLDLSRIEAGMVTQESKPVYLEKLLSDIVDFLGHKAAEKNQNLTLNLPDEALPALTADPLALESIFGNLITNALNYTQPGGTIRVKVELAGLSVRVSVIDNGFGIEARHLEKIFERFYRVKDEKTRFITGTGLGLPIVKGLVDSLGGFINVESTPGSGSTFTVVLPVNREQDGGDVK